MVKYLLKKSYLRKNLKEVKFDDLWNKEGVFTTMWIYGKPQKILFYKEHISNLIKSTKVYKIYNKNLKKNIIELINSNIISNRNYNHLLRIAVNRNIISISLRDKIKIKKNLELKLVNYLRVYPKHKNLKYKFILKNLSKMDTSMSDIALCSSGKILETGTSNIIFVKNRKFYSPNKNCYKGVNIKFLEKKFKIKKSDIKLSNINKYDEIILVGSGKGVSTARKIQNYNWSRKSLDMFKKLDFIYKKQIKNNNQYVF